MPTERFYHLPDEKKELIREAAIKEFCRVPLEKASINKIVKNADISRGSFYTYFQDKEDVLEYIFEDVVLQLQEYCKEVLKKNKGDFWSLPPDLLEHTLDLCQRERLFTLTQHANGGDRLVNILNKRVCTVTFSARKAEEGDPPQKEQSQQHDRKVMGERISLFLNELYRLTDTSKLKVSSVEEFQALLSASMMTLVGAIGEIYQLGSDVGYARWMFGKRLDYLKYGAVRQQEKGKEEILI